MAVHIETLRPLVIASTVHSYVCAALRSVHDTQNCKVSSYMSTLHSEAVVAYATVALTAYHLLS